MATKTLLRRPRLHRVGTKVQARLDALMAKNNEGLLDALERREFEKLGRFVEEISLANARLLAGSIASRPEADQ